MFLGFDYITPLQISPEERTSRSETLSLRVQTNRSTASRWRVRVGLEPDNGTGSQGAQLQTHRAINGVHTPFTMQMPQHLGTTPTVPADVFTNGAATAGSDTLMIDSTSALVIPQGRFITFTGSTKVYLVRSQVTATANTVASLNIYPALVSDVPNNTRLNFSPDITVRYTNEENTSITVTQGLVTRASMDVTEAL